MEDMYVYYDWGELAKRRKKRELRRHVTALDLIYGLEQSWGSQPSSVDRTIGQIEQYRNLGNVHTLPYVGFCS
jgi:hypothetical protein